MMIGGRTSGREVNGRPGLFGTVQRCVKERTVASRPSRSKKPKQPAWEVYRLKGSPAAFLRPPQRGRRLRSSVSCMPRTRRAQSRWQSRNTTSDRPISGGYLPGRASFAARRFPPPWTVEETDACFIVKDQTGHSDDETHAAGGCWRSHGPLSTPLPL